MTDNDFVLFLNSDSCDSSSFIQCCLEKLIGICDIETVEEIRKKYHIMDYDGAIQNIASEVQKNRIIKKQYPQSYSRILELSDSKEFKKNDSIYENLSRRMYEFLCGSKWFSSADPQHYQSIALLSQCLSQISPDKHEGLSAVTSPEHVYHVLFDLREIAESVEDLIKIEEWLRLEQAFKDRGAKRPDVPSTYHPGSFRSVHPVPRDLLLAQKSKKLSDVCKTTEKVGFSQSHPEAPFVNSISGTCFKFLAVISFFSKQHPKMTNRVLNEHVNNMFSALAAYMLVNGYHSMQEIVGVFDQENVQAFLKELKVKLDLSATAGNDMSSLASSSEYAVTLYQRREVNKLVQQSQRTASPTDSGIESMDSDDGSNDFTVISDASEDEKAGGGKFNIPP